uniref:Uncharacterized protein n=1 Tax=Roseihalotalea indica TaxID=2867963 RepID=A0AA49GL02_9BACT|nr:hypothetical protein K4G66_27200 [Tunicatimonas sp. TK19036]
MRLFFLALALLIVQFLTVNPAYSQTLSDTTLLWLVKTTDGNEYIGELISQTNQELRLKTRNLGEITIQNVDIISLEQIMPVRAQQRTAWQQHPHATRYFFAPNGYNLARGEGYYQNTWVLFNQVSLGLTDNVSLGVGMIPLFLFGGETTPFWITPKVSIPIRRDRINLGAGALIAGTIGYETSAVGIAYGVGTFGTRDRNVTLGLGYGFADGDWAESPAITLSGTSRIGARAFLLTENYFVDTGSGIAAVVSLGGRSLIGKSASLDYGLIIPTGDMDSFFAIPWLSVTIPFGRTKRNMRY